MCSAWRGAEPPQEDRRDRAGYWIVKFMSSSGSSLCAHHALTVAANRSGRSPFQAWPTPLASRACEFGSTWCSRAIEARIKGCSRSPATSSVGVWISAVFAGIENAPASWLAAMKPRIDNG
jgi:hypothetical protein